MSISLSLVKENKHREIKLLTFGLITYLLTRTSTKFKFTKRCAYMLCNDLNSEYSI